MPAFARCLFFLWAVSPVAAQTPEQGPAPRHVDHYGDPLPEGAIQRFGTLRLRHPELIDFTVLADGKTIVTVGHDKTIRRWDLDTGKQTSLVRLSEQAASGGMISADGSVVLAQANVEGVILMGVFDAVGRMIASFSIKEVFDPLNDLAISADGMRMAAAGADQRLILFDVKANRVKSVRLPAARPKFAEDPARLAFSPEGRQLPDSARRRMRLAFSPDGRRLAVCGGDDGRLVVLDSDTGKELFARKSAGVAAFFPSGDRLAVLEDIEIGRERFTVLRVTDTEAGNAVFTVAGPVSLSNPHLAVSPDGRWVAVKDRNAATVHDAKTGQVLRRLRVVDAPTFGTDFRFSADATKLILRSGSRLLVRNIADENPADDDSLPEFHRAASSPDGRWLAVPNSVTRTVELWETRSARLFRTLSGPPTGAHQVAFTADGRTVRAVDSDGNIWNWNTATGKATVVPLHVAEPLARLLWLTPDGRTVLTATEEGNAFNETLRVVVSDAASGDPRHAVSVNGVRINDPYPRQPNGDYFLTSSWRSESRLFDLRADKARGLYNGHLAGTSHDGRWFGLLTSDAEDPDGVIEIRDAASGEIANRLSAGGFSDLTRDLHIRGRKAVFMDEGQLWLLDLAAGKQRKAWPLGKKSKNPNYVFFNHHREPLVFLDANTVLTVFDDGTAMTWDLSAFPMKLLSEAHTGEDVASWWVDLADEPAKAYQAIWKLAETPSDTLVPFLRQHLRPVAGPTRAEWKGLVTDLNHPSFRVRAPAFRRLEQYGSGVLEELVPELRETHSPQVREQLERLATRQAGAVPSPETLRFLRALVVLEEVNTPAARRLVEELTHGVATARETTAAITTLSRMPDVESWRR